MNLKLKSILFIGFIILISTHEAHAVVAATSHGTHSAQTSRSLMNQTVDKKLTWRERIALKIVQWQTGKILGRHELSDTTLVSCSKIVLKNGKTIEANISQISKTEVKYRRCGFPSDPEMIESKDDISVVLAADGGALFVNNGTTSTQTTTSTTTTTQVNLMTESNAKLALWYSLLAWLCAMLASSTPFLAFVAITFAVAAIVFGIKSLIKFKKEPGKYKGKGRAIAALIIAGLFLFLVLMGTAAVLA